MMISRLNGARLDYWVARAEDIKCKLVIIGGKERCVMLSDDGTRKGFYHPSDFMPQAQPIIDREKGVIRHMRDMRRPFYIAQMGLSPFRYMQSGETPLIAAMLAYVESVFGATVRNKAPQSAR